MHKRQVQPPCFIVQAKQYTIADHRHHRAHSIKAATASRTRCPPAAATMLHPSRPSPILDISAAGSDICCGVSAEQRPKSVRDVS